MRTSAKGGVGGWSNADTCGQGEGGRKRGRFCGRPLWTTPMAFFQSFTTKCNFFPRFCVFYLGFHFTLGMLTLWTRWPHMNLAPSRSQAYIHTFTYIHIYVHVQTYICTCTNIYTYIYTFLERYAPVRPTGKWKWRKYSLYVSIVLGPSMIN